MALPSKTKPLSQEKGKVYDSLAIPKRNFTILLAWLLVAFMLIIFYIAIMLNALAYGLLVLLPLIAFIRPESVPQKKKNIAEMLHKIKTGIFWGGLSIVIWSILVGLFLLLLQNLSQAGYNVQFNGEIVLFFIFPLTTLCFDVIIFNAMAYFHQNEQGKQHMGWKKAKYSKDDAEHMIYFKIQKVQKMTVAVSILLFVFSLMVILVLNLIDIIPTPSTTQFFLVVGAVVLLVMVMTYQGIKKKMISKQMRLLNQSPGSIPGSMKVPN